MVKANLQFDARETRVVDRIARDAFNEEFKDRASGQDAAVRNTAGPAARKAVRQAAGRRAGSQRSATAFSTLTKINVIQKFLGLLPPEISSALQGAQLLGDLADVIPIVGRPVGAIAGAGLGGLLAAGARFRQEEMERRLARLATAGPSGLQAQGVGNIQVIKDTISRITKALTDPDASLFTLEGASALANDIASVTEGKLQQLRAYTDAVAARKDLATAHDDGIRAFYNANPHFIPPQVAEEIKEVHKSQKARLQSIPVTQRGRGG